MGELTLNNNAKLRAHEVHLIALAIGVNPCELFEYVCAGVELPGDFAPDVKQTVTSHAS